MNQRIVRAYDLDGTICNEVCWTKEECISATPNRKIIDDCNLHFNDSITIIYTARRDDLMVETLKWLRKNGVHYWAINNQKIPADFYIDDHALNVKDVI